MQASRESEAGADGGGRWAGQLSLGRRQPQSVSHSVGGSAIRAEARRAWGKKGRAEGHVREVHPAGGGQQTGRQTDRQTGRHEKENKKKIKIKINKIMCSHCRLIRKRSQLSTFLFFFCLVFVLFFCVTVFLCGCDCDCLRLCVCVRVKQTSHHAALGRATDFVRVSRAFFITVIKKAPIRPRRFLGVAFAFPSPVPRDGGIRIRFWDSFAGAMF